MLGTPRQLAALACTMALLDPLKLTAAPGPRLPEPARRLFDRVQRVVTRQLAALPRGGSPLTVSFSTPAYRTE
jgi:hypothetical protein